MFATQFLVKAKNFSILLLLSYTWRTELQKYVHTGLLQKIKITVREGKKAI